MSDEPTSWIEEFNAKVESVARFLNITTGSEIQAGAIEVLDETLATLKEKKATSIQAEDEDLANAVLGCECVAKALRSELQMWISLKKDDRTLHGTSLSPHSQLLWMPPDHIQAFNTGQSVTNDCL